MSKEMNTEEMIELYKELKRNAECVGSIETDFFFELVDKLLTELKKQTNIAKKEYNEHMLMREQRNRFEKENIRLKEENEKLSKANKIYINSIQNIAPVLNENYVEKDKIKEKIEELKIEYKEELEENSTRAFILKCQIEILEELLKES